MSTSAARNENRLTDADRKLIDGCLTDMVGSWPRTYKPTIGADALTMTRRAAYAIGCSLDDLRDSEVAEITVTVHAFIEAARLGMTHKRWTAAQLAALDAPLDS